MPTCLAEAHLWLGDLEVAQAMYRKRSTHACWNCMPPWPGGLLIAARGEHDHVARSPLMGEAPTVAERRVLELLLTHAPAAEDRRDPVRLTQNCEVAHALHLPQARRELAARRGRQGPRTGPAAQHRMAPRLHPDGRRSPASAAAKVAASAPLSGARSPGRAAVSWGSA